MLKMMTPWGMAQDQKELEPGLWHVSTASHGGYYVAPELRESMPALLRDCETWCGRGQWAGWYEEDCDWAIVALAFPQHFLSPVAGVSPQDMARATVERTSYMTSARTYLDRARAGA